MPSSSRKDRPRALLLALARAGGVPRIGNDSFQRQVVFLIQFESGFLPFRSDVGELSDHGSIEQAEPMEPFPPLSEATRTNP